jgi:RNA polymerase sigma factor (sigma-70 family)
MSLGTSTYQALDQQPGRPEVAELLFRARAGDRLAWDAIVERYAGLVMAVARAHGLDTHAAADVSQVTWLRLVEHLDELRQPDRLGPWLATTARRESIRTLRLAGREAAVDVRDLNQRPEQTSSVDADLLAAERNAELWQAFASLSESCQHLLRMFVADPPLRYAEIAAALHRPIGSLGPTRRRCLDCLRRALEAETPTGRRHMSE